MSQKLKRYKPIVVKYVFQDEVEGEEKKMEDSGITVMEETTTGSYVKYEDVKKLLQTLAEKVRGV